MTGLRFSCGIRIAAVTDVDLRTGNSARAARLLAPLVPMSGPAFGGLLATPSAYIAGC